MKLQWVLFFIMAFFVGSANAEGGCPAGQLPAQAGGGMSSCTPIPQGYYQQNAPQAPPRPTGEWIKTWGSIAMGSIDSTTSYGVPTGKMSKAEAEADALRRCASHGETDCRVMLTYHNQCAVIVEPHINGKPFSTGVVQFVSAGSIEKASEIAKSDCQQKNGATPEAQCEVVYKACSEPVFRRY